jgi:transcriptional regulator with XRE-family HTH domain
MMRRTKNHEARRLIATNLRKLRAAHGMTQEDLAAAANVDRSYISEIENERKSVSSDLVEDLADVFNVAIHEMFDPATAKRLDEAGPN